RHTRWPRDWSSDVCSSDLGANASFGTLLVALGGTAGINNITAGGRVGNLGPVTSLPVTQFGAIGVAAGAGGASNNAGVAGETPANGPPASTGGTSDVNYGGGGGG